MSNNTDDTSRLLIRIDHDQSYSYYTRFNRELLIPSGDSHFTLNLDHLHNSNKQPFASRKIRRIYVVTLEGDLQWQSAQLAETIGLPEGVFGWDFGPEGQNEAPGFHPVSSSSVYLNTATGTYDPMIKGNTRDRSRPYFDPLLQDGIEGLDQATLPLSNGFWHLRLWVEDIGEWEYLPHVLEKAITINGQTVLEQTLSPELWLTERYLKQPDLPTLSELIAQQQSTPILNQLQHKFWQNLAKGRGQMLETLVEVTDNKVQLDFYSPKQAGRFISALIATPADRHLVQALEEYQKSRLRHFQQHWPIIKNPHLEQYLPDAYTDQTLYWADHEEVTLRLTIPPTLGKLTQIRLPLKNLRIYQAQTQLRRAGGQENALRPELALSPLPFPPSSNSNIDRGQEQVWLITGRVSKEKEVQNPVLIFEQGQIAFTVEWLDVELPAMVKPVGIYLDYAPHLSWHWPDKRHEQAQCDYQFLNSFGLTGAAPALPTPIKGQEQAFKQAAQSPLLVGLQPPFPAYTPIKRLLQHPEPYALDLMEALTGTFGYMLWSLADEPGAFPKLDQQLNQFNQLLQQQLPQAKTFAQLNNPKHKDLANQYQAVLINHGYQLNQYRLQQLKKQGIDTYLYNLPWLRFAAGAYLWRSQALGFWQWHGRMPTAHPFDPTDGREDDVQLILPSEKVCGPSKIHSNLLALRQGVNDYRWLDWLSQNAQHNIEFAILEQDIKRQIDLDLG